jgi:hypothetical protein
VESSCHELVALDSLNGGGGGEGAIVVDGSNVYWTNGDDLRRVAISGGPGVTLVSNSQFRGLAQDGTYVYWATYGGGTVMRIAKNGGEAPAALAQGLAHPSKMAIDGGTLYWIDAPGVVKMSAVPNAVPSAISPDAYAHSDIAVDATSLYWGTNSATLIKRDKSTQATVVLADVIPSKIVVDGSAVYYSAFAPEPTTVSKVGGGCAGPVTVATGVYGTFALDASYVYFKGEKGLMRVPKTGGSPLMLSNVASPGQTFDHGVAVDGTYVYWTVNSTLMRYQK